MPTTYAIPDGRVAMAATLYTGTGAAQTISNAVNGVSFQPDFVWAKSRSSAESHRLEDSVRGATQALYSNLANAEATEAQSITAFGSTGFTLGTGTPNTSAVTYVGWQWKAGGTAVSNTAGSITSSVSANTTAGFSVVTYTGTGSAATVGHGLGVAPAMIIVKNRTTAGEGWHVYHQSLGATKAVFLNSTNAAGTNSDWWNNTAPTSSVFTVNTSGAVNGSGASLVAYCFAPVAGYSAFGKYTGNGSADGPFVFLNFQPRFVMRKKTSGVARWIVEDSAREPSNVANSGLFPNFANAEEVSTANWGIDFLSNGFKIRSTDTESNESGGTYIYYAVAENPFAYSNAR